MLTLQHECVDSGETDNGNFGDTTWIQYTICLDDGQQLTMHAGELETLKKEIARVEFAAQMAKVEFQDGKFATDKFAIDWAMEEVKKYFA